MLQQTRMSCIFFGLHKPLNLHTIIIIIRSTKREASESALDDQMARDRALDRDALLVCAHQGLEP